MFAKSKQAGFVAVLLIAAVCLGAVVLPPNTTARAAAAGAVLPPAVIVEVDSTEDRQAVTTGRSNRRSPSYRSTRPYVWNDGAEDAVLSGANGVVTEHVAVVATYLSMLPAGTVLRNPMLVAHRGLETKMLENSVSGMLAAYEVGADAVECDIQVSKDDRLVVMHDEDLLRTTNGAGEISAMLWDEINRYQLTYPKAAGYKESIPLLDDFFQAIKGNGKVLIVELKTNDQRSAPLLNQLIDTMSPIRSY